MKKIFLILFCTTALMLRAEDGSRLWLRMPQAKQPVAVSADKGMKMTPTLKIAQQELKNYVQGGVAVTLQVRPDAVKRDGFEIVNNKGQVTIASASQMGVLYGTYALLRMQACGKSLPQGVVAHEEPSYDLRVLNHWDNPDGTIERGYAGMSIWNWDELPKTLSPRYEAYARANASIGINATVLNNVNAKPMMLSDEMIKKVAALARVMRPYGIKVFLSVNFASPMVLDGLSTADPLHADVKKWWERKVKFIYKNIPDFGGFLVKANSEGQPGPQDYNRTHADGANMLADVLKPYNGVVMWRAFVYAPSSDDRACQAYNEFMPLDGQFRDNVIVQIKNGPIDFQPREPFSPLFGSMKKTQVMPELQITQEYLGESVHSVFLATMWKNCLDANTFHGEQATVGKVTQSRVAPHSVTAIAGVANIGNDVNWTRNDLAQANWYAFGRLAWNSQLSASQIADEFLQTTFTADERFVVPMRQVMLRSWHAAIQYMMPLGLHHIFAMEHHYGPGAWHDFEGGRDDWKPWYYHKADSLGIGFDRTMTGSKAVAQYAQPLASTYNNIETCPEDLLLWFHHVPWDYIMRNGLTLWDNLCYAYNEGVTLADGFAATWKKMQPYIDAERYNRLDIRFNRQARDARWWRDATLHYFARFSRLPLPVDCERPIFNGDDLLRYNLKMDNFSSPDFKDLP